MITETSAISTVSRILAPFIKSFYDGLSGKARLGFEVWQSTNGVDMAARYYHRLSHVKTIWARDDSVSIDQFYYPCRLAEGRQVKAINVIGDIECQYFVVQGIIGQGKSIFMRYLALSLFKSERLEYLPVFVELKNVSEKVTLSELICAELKVLGLDSSLKVLDALAKKNKIILLMDGFDEAPSACVATVIREISALQSSYPAIRIGVSSRPDNAIQNLPGFNILKLQHLMASDYEPFLAAIGVDTVQRLALILAIEDSPVEIRTVMNTPLMLSMVVIIYETYKEIPAYLSEFFNSLFHVVFTKHDRKKLAFTRQHFSGLTESELQHAFEAFCFVVTNTGKGRTLDLSGFEVCFNKSQTYLVGKKCTLEGFRKDIVGVACLMLEEGVGLTTFLHKGILDYFSAAFVRRMDTETVCRFYVKSADSFLKWQYVLGFLSRIDEYRFSKFFELGPLKKECGVISELIVSRDGARLQEFIEEAVPALKFFYRKSGDLSMENFKGVSLRYELLQPFTLDIYHRNPSRYDEYLRLTGVDDSTHSAYGGAAQFGLKRAFEFVGFDFAWSSLATIEFELLSRIENAEKSVLIHESTMNSMADDFGRS